jgi:oxygen-independent coproporphyrinogen-3 oxidase
MEISQTYNKAVIQGAPFSAARVSDLLARYDEQGPRYTSYPSVAQFAEFDSQKYFGALANSDTEAPLSIYVHIPFCNTPCYYCACNKIISRQAGAVRAYLNHLKKEMYLLRLCSNLSSRHVEQLHFGGGTPTYLDDAQLTELVHTMAHTFNLSQGEGRDYSIELDPRTMDGRRIELIRGLGFNRVSLGVQDFNANVQTAINRIQDFRQLESLVADIRVRGFSSLNFDMIYGLPKQTMETLEQTLTTLIAMSPDRVSYYNYAHLPQRFAGQRAINEADLPLPEVKIQMLRYIVERLTGAGYVYIGMDHFVKSTDTLAKAQREGSLCRNFQGYTISKARDLIGIGMSAISTVNSVYSQNFDQLDNYYEGISSGRLPIKRGFVSGDEDFLRRDIIQQLSSH